MGEPVVSVQGLRKSYGSLIAVDDLNLTVPPGAIFGLLGPNGAGKSTVFGVLGGWLRPSTGYARVLGTPTSELYKLRGQVAALPQDAQFPSNLSVREELNHLGRLMGLSAPRAQEETSRALERVGLTGASRLRGRELSHGMAKRAALAQALIGSPKVILLDEPTAGLDPRIAHEVRRVIQSLAPDATVLISSHNLVDIQSTCTHLAILDRGRLVVSGTMEALTRQTAELTVLLAPGSAAPLTQLQQQFGRGNVSLAIEGGRSELKLSFSSERAPTEVIGELLRLLLEHDTAILGLHCGTSLEAAFLALTRPDEPQPNP